MLNARDFAISPTSVNEDALLVVKTLHHHGFDGYIVGGGIRDLLVGLPPKDFDVVTNAPPEVVRRLFAKYHAILIGRRFKLVHVVFEHYSPIDTLAIKPNANLRVYKKRHVIEVSTYRSNNKHAGSLNEHGKIISDNVYGSQSDDATRRDFTVNALFYDPLEEQIIDYHHGIEDIKQRILRVIGNPELRFKEDPVRIIRAVRLAAKLKLTIESKTASGMHHALKLLSNEHKWRLYEEMVKILLSGNSYECILHLKQLELPRNVFLLFDDLFFSKQEIAMANEVLRKTDKRMSEGNEVSLVFILAGLLWTRINDLWQTKCASTDKRNKKRYQLLEVIHHYKETALNIGIARHVYSSMSDIWLMQCDFEHPTAKRAIKISQHRRFRQGWHLYDLRHAYQQVNSHIHDWWSRFIELEGDAQEPLLKTLPNVIRNKARAKVKAKDKTKAKTILQTKSKKTTVKNSKRNIKANKEV